jgi:hypothetical protein
MPKVDLFSAIQNKCYGIITYILFLDNFKMIVKNNLNSIQSN